MTLCLDKQQISVDDFENALSGADCRNIAVVACFRCCLGPSLPHDIFARFLSLRELHIGCNKLVDLPRSVCLLTALKMLSCQGNVLRSLPDDLGNLGLLESLDAGNNLLQELPDLRACASLQLLELSGNNNLQALPAWLGMLTSLQHIGLKRTLSLATAPEAVQNGDAAACLAWLRSKMAS